MKATIDLQTLLGFLSATGLPVLFNAVIKFLHPSIYTLTCGVGYYDTAPPCYADLRIEAALWLVLTAIAVAYGGLRVWLWLRANPTPPAGMKSAVIAEGEVPVTADRDGVAGLATAKALPGTTGEITPIPPAPKG